VWEHHKKGGRTVWNQVAELEKDYTGNLQQIKADFLILLVKKSKLNCGLMLVNPLVKTGLLGKMLKSPLGRKQ